MDSNDVFSADAELDQSLRARNKGASSKAATTYERANKPGKSSPEPYNDSEEAPLLSDGGSSRRGSTDSEAEADPPWSGAADFQGLPWWKTPSIYWLLPPFLLFTMAFGGIIVPKLNLILTLICNDYYADRSLDHPNGGPVVLGGKNARCRNDEISARVSLFTLYGNLATGILSAITSPKLGALSDRYGRKKLLCITTCGMLVGEAITILAATYPDTMDVNWILLGYALDGLCGSFTVGMALAHSYAADCTSPQKRNVAFAYFHACLFTGIAVGPILAGYIIKVFGSVLLVFYLALGCHVVFIFFLLFCIPESLSKSRQEAARQKYRAEMERLGPSSDWVNQLRSANLLQPLKILYPTGTGSSNAVRRNLLLLAATDTIMFGVTMGAMGVIVIYTQLEFGWEEWESSKFVSTVNVCRVLCLLVLLPLVTRIVRGKEGTSRQRSSGSDLFDLTVIRVAIFFDMLGYLGFSLSRSGSLFTLSGAIASIGGVGSPTLGAALTKHVQPDRVGQLLGATGLLHAIARVVGPLIFNGIYYATVKNFRQTVFVCLTATFGLAFVCSWLVRPHVYLEDLEPNGSSSRMEDTDEEAAPIR